MGEWTGIYHTVFMTRLDILDEYRRELIIWPDHLYVKIDFDGITENKDVSLYLQVWILG